MGKLVTNGWNLSLYMSKNLTTWIWNQKFVIKEVFQTIYSILFSFLFSILSKHLVLCKFNSISIFISVPQPLIWKSKRSVGGCYTVMGRLFWPRVMCKWKKHWCKMELLSLKFFGKLYGPSASADTFHILLEMFTYYLRR